MRDTVFLVKLISISSTLITTKKEGEDCKWICGGLLSDHNDLVNSDTRNNLTAITEELSDACNKDLEFAKYVDDPVDIACPDFCESFIPTIKDEEAAPKQYTNFVRSTTTTRRGDYHK